MTFDRIPFLTRRAPASRGFPGATSGAAAVEFAIVLLPMCLLLMGTIDYGWYFFVDLACTNAAREGARTATLYAGACPNGVAINAGRTAVETFLTGVLPAAYAPAITSTCTMVGSSPQFTFAITLTFPELTGFTLIPLPGGMAGAATIQTSATMRGVTSGAPPHRWVDPMAGYLPSDRRPATRHASRQIRARAFGFMLVALGAGLGSAVLVVRYVRAHSGAVVATVKVVVAAADVPVAGSLTPAVLKVVDWPASAQPEGSFDRVEPLAGRVARSALVTGEPVVEARLSPEGAGAGMASLIPPDMRAMTVLVNDVVGVSGFIHPGDLVDVITTMQGPPPDGNGAFSGLDQFRSKIVLQEIRVLAVGQQLSADTNKPQQVPAVTLLVSPEQSERLALASTQGKVQLTMRSQIDRGQRETSGVSPPELLGISRAAPSATATTKPAIAYRYLPAPRRAAAAPPPPPDEGIVEVLHGDRVERRQVSGGGRP